MAREEQERPVFKVPLPRKSILGECSLTSFFSVFEVEEFCAIDMFCLNSRVSV